MDREAGDSALFHLVSDSRPGSMHFIQVILMSLMAVFFLVIVVVPVAWLVSRLFTDTGPILITWIVAGVIIVGGLIAFVINTFEEGMGGEGGWGEMYREVGEGEF